VRISAFLALFGTIALSHARAQDTIPSCNGGGGQLAQCIEEALAVEDKRLSALYDLVTKMFVAGTIGPSWSFYDEPKELKAAQQAWLQFRDAQCRAETSLVGPLSASGVVAGTGDCVLRMTRERIAFFQKLAEMIGHYSKLCAANPDACRLDVTSRS
jgi:uncharacterized protein YecT (DUF1311 family)